MDELREKIAALDCKSCYSRSGIKYKPCSLGYILGKCPGYYNFTDQILALVKEAGYVRLSQDQSLPNKPPYLTLAQGGYKQALVDICEAGWRKVEL